MTFAAALRPHTKLISIMMANNETGVLQPVEEIGKIAAETDVYFHTDAVQAAGKVPIDVNCLGCDLLSISGHKLHAPQGVGAIYVGKGTILQPMLHGGSHERSRRAGTENVPGIVGLGKAAELAREALERGDLARMSAMRDHTEQKILSELEAAGVNGAGAPRVPNTTNIHFDGIEGEALVIALDLKGLAVSTGAACSSGATRTIARPNRHGLAARNSPRQPPLQPGKNKARSKTLNLGFEPRTVNRNPPARSVAGLQ